MHTTVPSQNPAPPVTYRDALVSLLGHLPSGQYELLGLCYTSHSGLTLAALRTFSQQPRTTLSSNLRRLVDRGLLLRPGRGLYARPPLDELVLPSGPPLLNHELDPGARRTLEEQRHNLSLRTLAVLRVLLATDRALAPRQILELMPREFLGHDTGWIDASLQRLLQLRLVYKVARGLYERTLLTRELPQFDTESTVTTNQLPSQL